MDHAVVVEGLGISWHTLGIIYVAHVAHLHCRSQDIGCSCTFIRHLLYLHPLVILLYDFVIFLDALIATTLFIVDFLDVADVFIDRRVDGRLWTFIERGCGRGRGRIDKIFHGTH